jgi:diaminohydroxyphosphoribosylaminopyrimidine deaminase/5-amino-6-(5-phosphoribosylamino)uracil reductase
MRLSDEYWMSKAIRLAKQGARSTTPNPNVGCVIVKEGVQVGAGFHQKAGTPHAEVHALKEAGHAAQDATAYVTLEPCSHFGRTPPCADALVSAGVSRVVCAMKDPNPQVAGTGLVKLESTGISVTSGVLEAQAEALNPGFLKRMRTGRPYVTLKMASSLDGASALSSGESQWITGSEARTDVQKGRAISCAIVTGIGTVLADNPSMNVRLDHTSRQPDRVILDSTLRTPIDAQILNAEGSVWLLHGPEAPAAKRVALEAAGFRLAPLKLRTGRLDLTAFLDWAGAQQYNRLWVEAGATLAGGFVEAGLVDEILLYQAPKLLGANTRPVIKTVFDQLSDAPDLSVTDTRFVGNDIRWTLKPQKP